jgi:hypothetical protein
MRDKVREIDKVIVRCISILGCANVGSYKWVGLFEVRL